MFLTTNTSSTIIQSNDTIDKNELVPSELKTSIVPLPPNNVHSAKIRYFCTHCRNFNENACPNPILFNCSDCRSNSMTIRLKKKVEAKLEVNIDGLDKTVFVAGPQMKKFFELQNQSLPGGAQDLSDVALLFLQESPKNDSRWSL